MWRGRRYGVGAWVASLALMALVPGGRRRRGPALAPAQLQLRRRRQPRLPLRQRQIMGLFKDLLSGNSGRLLPADAPATLESFGRFNGPVPGGDVAAGIELGQALKQPLAAEPDRVLDELVAACDSVGGWSILRRLGHPQRLHPRPRGRPPLRPYRRRPARHAGGGGLRPRRHPDDPHPAGDRPPARQARRRARSR